MAARKEATKEASFEESLAELETIVEQMETGEPSLADLMENYSRGIRLSQKCMKALERAEKAMDLLVKEKTGETEALARSAHPQDTTYLVPAFSGLGMPHWNSEAKALICGMTRLTGKAELARLLKKRRIHYENSSFIQPYIFIVLVSCRYDEKLFGSRT